MWFSVLVSSHHRHSNKLLFFLVLRWTKSPSRCVAVCFCVARDVTTVRWRGHTVAVVSRSSRSLQGLGRLSDGLDLWPVSVEIRARFGFLFLKRFITLNEIAVWAETVLVCKVSSEGASIPPSENTVILVKVRKYMCVCFRHKYFYIQLLCECGGPAESHVDPVSVIWVQIYSDLSCQSKGLLSTSCG